MKSEQSVKKAMVHVLGCKVNQAEAAAMVRVLEDRGYQVASDIPDPDLIVVNTCCVTAKAEGKSRRAVGRLAQRFPDARIVVTGCLAAVNPDSLKDLANETVILGTYEKDRFEDFVTTGGEKDRYFEQSSRALKKEVSLNPPVVRGARQDLPGNHGHTRISDEVRENGPREREALPDAPEAGERASKRWQFVDLGVSGNPARARAFLKIQDGCNQRCSYCIVPAARGRSRSLDREKALANAAALSSAGYAEIVLTGIHLGYYGQDLEPPLRLEDLVEELLETCPRVRFRMSSIEPQEITPGLIDLTARNKRLCSHFHIPLQSGDDEILGRMKRPYTASAVRNLANAVIDKVPDVCIGFDVMVGFPGEDDRSFRRTVDLVRSSGAAYLHVFPFSPRPGTPAADFRPLVPSAKARERVAELRKLSRELRRNFYSRFIGRTLSAVLESESETTEGTVIARTDNYIPVRVCMSGPIPNDRAFRVTLESIGDDGVLGSPSPGIE
ncbi:MAG: tRNA (N(6)-L-threonylcarbamoyladenosine(37)-C(2))-methylthiotransferase MtaB [Pseudomonadota bacterium]